MGRVWGIAGLVCLGVLGCGGDSGEESTASTEPATVQELQPSCEDLCSRAATCGWPSGSLPSCPKACAASMYGLWFTEADAEAVVDCYAASGCDMICEACGYDWGCE